MASNIWHAMPWLLFFCSANLPSRTVGPSMPCWMLTPLIKGGNTHVFTCYAYATLEPADARLLGTSFSIVPEALGDSVLFCCFPKGKW